MRFCLLALFLMLSNACSVTEKTHIAARDLWQKIQDRQAPLIIDVRSQSEYERGHVPGAIHIPFWASFSTQKLKSYPADEPLVLYCAHGPRAGIAKMAFILSGFDNIRYLQGHMSAWYEAHLPVESLKQ